MKLSHFLIFIPTNTMWEVKSKKFFMDINSIKSKMDSDYCSKNPYKVQVWEVIFFESMLPRGTSSSVPGLQACSCFTLLLITPKLDYFGKIC